MTEQNNQLATTQQQVAFNLFDAQQFETMQRVCKMFANSDLVPDMYKASDKNSLEKAMANCMIAVEMSQRIGASPLMVMQNMVIIYGKPSWSSKFLIATVNSCGRFNPLQFKFTNKGKLGVFEYTEYEKKWTNNPNGGKGFYKNEAKQIKFDGTKIDDIECVAYTTKKGSDEVLESSPISIKMAIEERWYTKEGSKWRTMPLLMLMYRAASFWTNVYAPELSMGMKTVEEVIDIRDIQDVEYEDVSSEQKKRNEMVNNTPQKEVSIDDLFPDGDANSTDQVPEEPKIEEPPY